MSGIDQGTLDTIERQRRLAAALSSKTPPSVADRLAKLELKSAQDLDLIHRAIARIGALEEYRAFNVPSGMKMLTASDWNETERIVKEQRARIAALESEAHTFPPGFRMVAVDEWERVKREAAGAEELARECAAVGWMASQNHGGPYSMTKGDVSESVRVIHNSTSSIDAVKDAVIAKARERLAARAASPAPAKGEAAPITRSDFAGFNKGFESNARADMDALEPAPDSGAFKSAEEDAELVAMGILMVKEPYGEHQPIGMVSPVGGWEIKWTHDRKLLGKTFGWRPLMAHAGISAENRALLRKVRREREASR